MRYFRRNDEVVHTRDGDPLTRDLELHNEWEEIDGPDGDPIVADDDSVGEVKELDDLTVAELDDLAEELNVEDYVKGAKKDEKVAAIRAHQEAAVEEDEEPAEAGDGTSETETVEE